MGERRRIAERVVRGLAPRDAGGRPWRRQPPPRLVAGRVEPGDQGVRVTVCERGGAEVGHVLIGPDDALVFGSHLVIAGSFLRGVPAVRDPDDRTPGPGDVPLTGSADG